MKKITLNVKGMHCRSCGLLIKDSLEEFDGVKQVEASHETGKVSVEYDEKQVDISKIKNIIKNEGYEVQ